jgi:hypothetical protein
VAAADHRQQGPGEQNNNVVAVHSGPPAGAKERR